uniref:hypothetical protein n=1 Tax=Streptomyces prunicolor TaxID=67348 RepID=UPI002953F13F|nr:hypothetical protein [Streptomyces prunicolor]
MGRGLAIATTPARRSGARALDGIVAVIIEVAAAAVAANPPAPTALPPRGTPLRLAVLGVSVVPGIGCVRLRARVNCARVGLS